MKLFSIKLWGTVEIKIVFEIRDWWVGLYFGEFHYANRKIWIGILPTLPICISWWRDPS